MNRLIVAVGLAVLSMTAHAKHVYPRNLTPVANGATFTLAENYVVSEKAATFTLAAGTYVQRFEDRKGIYLIGDDRCVEMSVVPPKNPAAAWKDTWECGIYLPKDPAAGATFFFIRRTPDEPHSGNGLLIDSIIRAGYGSFDFPMSNRNDLRLRSQLVERLESEPKT
jgi:hypothetical protein